MNTVQESKSSSRRAVVVGAGSGMGAAVAAKLHQDGYQLVLADLSLDRLKDMANQFRAETAQVDIASEDTVRALASRCSAGVDALVITAGLSMTMASFERIMDVNLAGTARVLLHFAPLMKRGGAAICFASIAGHLVASSVDQRVKAILDQPLSTGLVGNLKEVLPAEMCIPGMAYSLSKLGVMTLAKRTAVEWGKNGARVCSISPGLIDTPMGSLERKSSANADDAVAAAPIPRLGTADEVANVAAFLCSPQAGYITACDLLVDGGWVGAIETGSPDSPFAKALAAGREKT